MPALSHRRADSGLDDTGARLYSTGVRTTVVLSVLLFIALPSTAQQVTFATYPFGDAQSIYRAFSPMVRHLSDETGIDMRLTVTRDYAELSDRLVDGTVDFAWIGSANYVRTRTRLPAIRYLATYMERDATLTRLQPYYQSVILTLAAGPFESLSDLRSTRFGFTSPDSTSGYAYPRMILDQHGIDPDTFFRSVFFLGRHTDVVAALLAGSLDAGAVSDGTYRNATDEHGDIFRVLAWSDPIPLDAIVAAPHVDDTVTAAVRDALVAIPESHPTLAAIQTHVGWPAGGFAVRDDSFYDSVERALSYTTNE